MVIRLLVAMAIALLGPPAAVSTAHASTDDDNKFLALLKADGIIDHISPSHAIEAAHTVCQKLDSGATINDVANDLLNSSSMPAYDCGYFIGASIRIYCPQYIAARTTSPEERPGS